MWKPNPAMSDDDCNLDYFMDQIVIAGDPDEVTKQILALRERVGPFGTLVLTAHDWDDRATWLHSLELFSSEVVPRLAAPDHSGETLAGRQVGGAAEVSG